MNSQNGHVIETTELTKRYGDVVAVDRLTLRVPRGGVFGFLGPNGSGKTTTMGMLLGLVHPTSGEARIFGDPELVFLYEPTNGLDPAGVVEVRELIRDLGKGGRTVVLSSHLLAETELVCDNVAVLSRGKLIAQGSIQELLRQHDGLRLRTTDDSKARALLAGMRWVEQVEHQDGGLMVTASQARAWEISRELALQQVYVNELTPVHRSLEEFFMEITGTDPATGKERS